MITKDLCASLAFDSHYSNIKETILGETVVEKQAVI
jgi:hypothetical protein